MSSPLWEFSLDEFKSLQNANPTELTLALPGYQNLLLVVVERVVPLGVCVGRPDRGRPLQGQYPMGTSRLGTVNSRMLSRSRSNTENLPAASCRAVRHPGCV